VPGADVTNISFHVAITLVIEAADKCYSHEGEEEKTQTKISNQHPVCEKLLCPPDSSLTSPELKKCYPT
jgi:hypothetical protein